MRALGFSPDQKCLLSLVCPRDVFLRCQARSNCKSAHAKSSSSSTQDILPMINETRAANSQLKLKRRHVNLTLADIQLAKTALLDDPTLQHAGPPRPAPLPSVSPSPDSKSSSDLEFSVSSLRFPRPPSFYRTGSESPVPSMSSCSSTSLETQSLSLPTTPSSSGHDQYFSCHQSPTPFHPVIIKPLVITKHNRPRASRPRASSTLPSKLAPKRPLPPPPMFQDDSDSESDSEWYSRELSKIVTLRSSVLPDLPTKGRPDSMCISHNQTSSPTPATPPRIFSSPKPHPPFPRCRNHISIPDHLSPSVPISPKRVPATPTSPKTSISRSNLLPFAPLRRPPPRSSIPADCVLVDDTFTFSDDSDSAFSFSLYDRSPVPSARPDSPKSAFSQRFFQSPCASPFPPSFPSTPSSAYPFSVGEEFDFAVEDLQFDMKRDRTAMPVFDIPTSPLDLEVDLTSHFEQLRNESHPQSLNVSGAPTDGILSPSPEYRESSVGDKVREPRSRWSSSTLNSVLEEQSRRSAIGVALRAYFGPSPRRSGSDPIPKMPTSMARRHKESKRELDVMVIGYGHSA